MTMTRFARTFFIKHQHSTKAEMISASDPATALKRYAKKYNLGQVIVPLRDEQPSTVFTHNGNADYVCSRWSAQIGTAGRFYIHD